MAGAGARVMLIQGDPLPPAAAADQPDATAGASSPDVPHYRLLQLPNPATGGPQQYLLSAAGLLELNRVKQAASCWLVGEAFVSDGSGYLATPVNAGLVLLALLSTAPPPEQQEAAAAGGAGGGSSGSGMFQEPESLLCCEAWPDAQQLLPLAAVHLPCLCDTKRPYGDDTTFYKLSRSRVLAYLRVCTANVLAGFRSHSPSSIAGLPDAEQQSYAIRFMREYVSPAWWDALVTTYGLTPSSMNAANGVLTARPASDATATDGSGGGGSGGSDQKKVKVVDPKDAARRKAEEGRAAAAAARLAKQAAGSKKISSFFQAKPKQQQKP